MTTRVLHVLRDLSRNGGVQRLVYDMARAAPVFDLQAEVMVYVDEPGPSYIAPLREAGVPVHVVSRSAWLTQRKLMRQADVVHAHLFPALYLAALFRPGSVYTEHNTTNNRRKPWFRPLERWAYARYSRVTCISPEVEAALRAFLGQAHPVAAQVVYNGVDVTGLQSSANKARAALPPRAGFHIAMVGSLTAKKNQACLIRSLTHLAPDTHLHLAGDGPTRADLMQLASRLGVAQRVHFHGVVTDIPGFLAGAQLYVQSSHWEGFGLAAIEAMSCDIPSLCADVPGLNQLSSDRMLVFPAGDDVALAAKIRQFREEPSFRQRLQDICNDTAQRFSLVAMMQRFADEYRHLSISRC